MAAPATAPRVEKTGATGTIVQITGVVVDIEFPADQLPSIYNALETHLNDGTRLVLEVQQHLGDDRVRAVACVAEVVRVAAREQDDIAPAYVFDVRVSVDPKREFALFDDVQAADIGEADRESPQRRVRNDPFSA